MYCLNSSPNLSGKLLIPAAIILCGSFIQSYNFACSIDIKPYAVLNVCNTFLNGCKHK